MIDKLSGQVAALTNSFQQANPQQANPQQAGGNPVVLPLQPQQPVRHQQQNIQPQPSPPYQQPALPQQQWPQQQQQHQQSGQLGQLPSPQQQPQQQWKQPQQQAGGPAGYLPPRHFQQAPWSDAALATANANLAKAALHQDSKVWLMKGQVCWFVVRGGTFASVPMEIGDFDNLTRATANHNAGMHPLLTWGSIDITAFAPPLPPGVTAVGRTFDVYFATFVRVFKVVIRDGMINASATANGRVNFIISELQTIADSLRDYCQLHHAEFVGRELDVFERFKQDANLDWADFVSQVAVKARGLRQANPLAAPPEGTGGAITPPQFTRTARLITEHSPSAMIGLMRGGLAVQPGTTKQPATTKSTASNKRKATSPATNNRAAPAATEFAKNVANWGTPPDQCFHSWAGGTCPRPTCDKNHDQRHPHLLPPPPPPSAPVANASAAVPTAAPRAAPVARYSGRGSGAGRGAGGGGSAGGGRGGINT